jgi:hypothetical protein
LIVKKKQVHLKTTNGYGIYMISIAREKESIKAEIDPTIGNFKLKNNGGAYYKSNNDMS